MERKECFKMMCYEVSETDEGKKLIENLKARYLLAMKKSLEQETFWERKVKTD